MNTKKKITTSLVSFYSGGTAKWFYVQIFEKSWKRSQSLGEIGGEE